MQERLFEKRIFSPEFILKLKKFKNTRRALDLIAGCWGGCTIDEAESNLVELKEYLMETKKEDEYPPDYKGDRTFEKDVDDIIEHLRGIVRSLQK
jgi:hypothetical protein